MSNYTVKNYRKKIKFLVICILVCCLALLIVEITIYNLNNENSWGLTKWLASSHFLLNLSVAITATVIMYFAFEKYIASQLFYTLGNAYQEGEFEKFIPKGGEKPILSAVFRRLSKGNNSYVECQNAILENHQDRFKNYSEILIKDLTYNFTIKEAHKVKSNEIDKEHFEIECQMSYKRRILAKKILFKVIWADETKTQSPLIDIDAEFVWALILDKPKGGRITKRHFDLLDVSIRDQAIPKKCIQRVSVPGGIQFEINFEDLDYDDPKSGGRDFPYELNFNFKALQLRRFGFVAANVKYFSRDLTVIANYKNAPFIKNVWGVNHVAGSNYVLPDHRGNDHNYKVEHRGWIIPESGVTISWGN